MAETAISVKKSALYMCKMGHSSSSVIMDNSDRRRRKATIVSSPFPYIHMCVCVCVCVFPGSADIITMSTTNTSTEKRNFTLESCYIPHITPQHHLQHRLTNLRMLSISTGISHQLGLPSANCPSLVSVSPYIYIYIYTCVCVCVCVHYWDMSVP